MNVLLFSTNKTDKQEEGMLRSLCWFFNNRECLSLLSVLSKFCARLHSIRTLLTFLIPFAFRAAIYIRHVLQNKTELLSLFMALCNDAFPETLCALIWLCNSFETFPYDLFSLTVSMCGERVSKTLLSSTTRQFLKRLAD